VQDGQTALHVASRVVNCIHQLAPVCSVQDGQTALHVATRVVNNRIHQLAPLCRVQDGQTALHVASRVGDVGTVQLVISRGADVDAATADGYTALHIAAKEGHDDVAHALLELGASTTPTTKARRHTVLVASGRIASDTIRYDTRCYFNVRSKADISQLNLPHGT